ncbi:MAG: hypothetical protein F9K16_12295 [Thermoanaerobaculia bacterium]|nr:MAG: hypothetical protein F9K16_12295 [Thermoanaerobaculia bacterium]MBZ0102805.1 hypothetical protein [Thermoanaerobaculia bacterium]
MIRRFVSKELAEHWRLLLGVVTLEVVCFLLLLGRALVQNTSISVLTSLRDFFWLVVPVASSIVMQALFAKELRNRTILFLETLPVPRSSPIVAKLVVAITPLFGGALAALGLALLAATRSEPIEWLFTAILTAKATVLVVFVFAITFLASVLGRYRWPLYFSLLALLYIYEEAGGELRRVPLLALLGRSFASERYDFPTGDLVWTTVVSVALVAFGLLLLLLRSGSPAILLGERMTHREKVLVAGVLLTSMLATDVLTDGKPEPPYQIKSAAAIRTATPKLALTIVPPFGSSTRLEGVAEMLHSSLEPLADLLGADELPPVFIIHREDLDDHRFELAHARERDGVVVRANLQGNPLALRSLLAFITGVLIDDVSDEQSQAESRSWLRDGLAELWAVQHLQSESDANVDELWLRALHANLRGFDPSDVDRWYSVQESLGEPIAAAFAWSGLVVLSETVGPDLAQELIRQALQPQSNFGFRSADPERPSSVESLLEPHLERSELFDRWRTRLAVEALRLAPRLARIPRWSATVSIEETGQSRRATFSGSADRVPEEEGLISLLWTRLPAIDEPLSPLDLAREERPLEREVAIPVPASLPSGARIFLAASAYSTELGCESRFGATRRTIP